jgi:hypothetical protein
MQKLLSQELVQWRNVVKAADLKVQKILRIFCHEAKFGQATALTGA